MPLNEDFGSIWLIEPAVSRATRLLVPERGVLEEGVVNVVSPSS